MICLSFSKVLCIVASPPFDLIHPKHATQLKQIEGEYLPSMSLSIFTCSVIKMSFLKPFTFHVYYSISCLRSCSTRFPT